jgi:hypothetical protein
MEQNLKEKIEKIKEAIMKDYIYDNPVLIFNDKTNEYMCGVKHKELDKYLILSKIPADNKYEITSDIMEYCLNKYNKTIFSKNGKYVAIMLESRYMDNIKTILIQMSRFLTSDWSVILYVTNDVYDKYNELIKSLDNNIILKVLDENLTSVADYNKILFNVNFWNQLKNFEKVLIFQSDTMMYRFGIEKFLQYDYIGAPWPEQLGLNTCVGNGGFSLRTIDAINNCLNNIDSITIPHYEQYNKNQEKLGRQPEDVFFSVGMKQLGYNIPDINTSKFFSIETCEFNLNCLGSHQLDTFNKTLSNTLLNNSIIPYYLSNEKEIKGHRFGWKYVTESVSKYFCNRDGIRFYSWLDVDYVFNTNSLLYKINKNKNWVGILHLTPVSFKKYYKNCDIDILFENNEFIENLKYCKGLFTLSKYMKKYIEDKLISIGFSNILVNSLYHPVYISEPYFNPKTIDTYDTIVSLGIQLRKNTTIYKLNTNHKKIWLPGRDKEYANKFLLEECNEFNITLSKKELKSVYILQLSDDEYDKVLLSSIVIIDIYNASANNSIIECISKNIPCFVSNIESIKEYIGEDYPLLFSNIDELSSKIKNKSLIREAYNYLISRPYLKERLYIDNFIKGILNSEITKNILTVDMTI